MSAFIQCKLINIFEVFKNRIDLKEDFIKYPFYIISRPFKGFSDLKYENRGKMYFALMVVILMCFFNIYNEMYKGFVLAEYYTENKTVNTIYIVFMTIVPIILFVIANWSVTAVANGSGKMKEIFMVYAYASYPKIIFSLIGLILSNFVTVEEAAFAMFFYSLGTVAFLFYLFVGLVVIHEYSFTQSVLMIVMTVIVMCIIVFIVALLLALSNEVIVFIRTVVEELTMRL